MQQFFRKFSKTEKFKFTKPVPGTRNLTVDTDVTNIKKLD